MFLIKQAQVYAPEYLGVKDVLICGGKIEAIEDHIDDQIPFCQVIDGTGKKLTPGIIDPHVHITGGGGEGSFHTQVPPVKLSELIGGGVTTVVGLLGTDGISRNVESLLARVKALREEGLTVYALTGSYGYPSVTLTGDVKKDIMFVEEIIGGTPISKTRPSPWNKSVPPKTAGKSVPKPAHVPSAILWPSATPK